ncbi:Piso0_002313 [Millerozyma farinosa CBS 7064]|uniref:Protein YAE1 n=1 Tax=Pichia sorbitophila (strain ATCC MYA-4447 / BCRC 22081 / CBS 7064 / NBRC 10061 / NRRL Y-12695) TaxID=559304 RepID=G8YCA1_PICSO|nr:Piso0_002313 [Millerozyma farinosa CBS 7064]
MSENAPSVDDVWEENDSRELESSTADIRRIHKKQGYLDGLMRAKESSLQAGFDDSFPKGADLGITAGYILAQLVSHKDENMLQQAKQELNIAKVLSKKYFSSTLEIEGDEHPVMEKWKDQVTGSK